jgi:hypothetical protein
MPEVLYPSSCHVEKGVKMKTNMKYVLAIASMGFAFALTCMAGPTVIVSPPTVVVSAPPPVAVSPAPVVACPDSYVWDGDEYVGVVGDQYYYLGPGNAWIIMDPTRLHHFQAWESGNPHWRDHMTHNTRYREMAHAARPQPMHNETRSGGPAQPPPQPPTPHVNPGNYGPP